MKQKFNVLRNFDFNDIYKEARAMAAGGKQGKNAFAVGKTSFAERVRIFQVIYSTDIYVDQGTKKRRLLIQVIVDHLINIVVRKASVCLEDR